LHRLLIYAAFSDKDTLISCRNTGAEDVHATINCLSALGCVIGRNEDGFAVTPIDRTDLPYHSKEPLIFPCGESGSTLRFMLPIVCALGIRGAFEMKGRLPDRPLSPLDTQLEEHGITLHREKNMLYCEGELKPKFDYKLPGDVSSQYVSGLLMALPLLSKPSRLTVTGSIESAGYIEMTLQAAESFGQRPEITQNLYDDEQNTSFDTRQKTEYNIRGMSLFESPGRVETEGDWSNSAFWLCAGAMPRGNIRVKGLRRDTHQGDRDIYNILAKMGADIIWEGDVLTVKEDKRFSTEVDGRLIPDLIPIIAAVACVGSGKTHIRNASRLRIKECDRLVATAKILTTLGADIVENPDGFTINGVPKLRGGVVDAHNDHRIAMMAAIASAACVHPVTITGAQAVNKSYPDFWKDLRAMGKKVIEE
jgi:3-phosphoshikimate 1-carboxyvinyltransferase